MILPWIQEQVDTRAWVPADKVRIVRARYPAEAALLGVHVLFEQELHFL